LAAMLNDELEIARKFLHASVRTILPPYLLFSAEGMRERVATLLEGKAGSLPPRNSRTRERERHLLLYLQRVAAKNDTFSAFGPSGWGKVSDGVSGIVLAPEQGIAKREAFLERWTAHAIADVINADPNNSNPKLAVPALEPDAMEVLRDDAERWPSNPVRDRWLWILSELVELSQKFSATTSIQDRQSIMQRRIRSARSVFANVILKLMIA
jgi:hypothetical protein